MSHKILNKGSPQSGKYTALFALYHFPTCDKIIPQKAVILGLNKGFSGYRSIRVPSHLRGTRLRLSSRLVQIFTLRGSDQTNFSSHNESLKVT
jgi:hypothetical protein